MKIRTLFIINLLAIFTAAGLIIFSALKYEAFKNLNSTEIKALQDKNNQIIRTIQNEIDNMVAYTRDWARWDETFLFLQDGQDSSYTQANFSQEMLVDLGAVGMLFLTKDFQPYFSYARNDQKKIFNQISQQILEKKTLLQSAINKGSHYVLLYQPEQRVYFWAAIHPVTPTNYDHISNGYFVTSKLLDKNFLEKINRLTGYSLNFHPQTVNTSGKILHQSEFAHFFGSVSLLDQETAQLDIIIHDSEKKTGLSLRTNVHRALNLQIQKVFHHTLLVIFSTGIIVVLLNLLLIQFLVVRPTDYLARGFTLFARKRSIDRRLKVSGPAEIRRMTEAANMMLNEIEALHHQVEELSRIDDLTGTFNRRYFDELFRREFRRSLRENRPLALLMLDIDFFKEFNDHYGHVAGDECLRQVADILKGCLQRAGDIVARYGGEEFIIMLSNTPVSDLNVLVERIIEALENAGIKHEFSDAAQHVSCSIGAISVAPSFPGDAQKMLLKADELLYQAKEKGRNQAALSDSLWQG